MLPLTTKLQSLTRWITGRPRLHSRRRRRDVRLRRGAELLENRILLSAAPAIVSLELENDTGTPGDNVTTDATVTGTVTNDGPVAGLTVEFDYDGDGVLDRTTATDPMGNFTYDVGTDVNFGQVSVAVRASEWDPDTASIQFSPWQSLSFEYEAPPNDPAEVTNLQVDAGGILSGDITNDGPVLGITVELDYDADGVMDQLTVSDAMGSFSRDVGADLGYGQHTVAARAVEWDPATGGILLGAWESITYDFQPPANGPADVANLHVDAGGILTGTVTNDGPVSGIMVELDYDADGIPDQTTLSDAAGNFSHNVGADLGSGQHTIRVRAAEWDMATATTLHGTWHSVAFNYTAPNVAPQITNFSVVFVGNDTWVFQGQFVDEHPGTVMINFGGVLAGHSTLGWPDGTFMYSVTLTPQQRGPVSAQATDDGRLLSNVKWDLII